MKTLKRIVGLSVPILALSSVALAQAWGITLVGYARQNRLNVYAGVERLQTDR